MPLKAMCNDKFFYSENLEEHHRNEKFICPICDVKLIPVIPKKNIIKHFRHETGQSHGEPDGPEHRSMKTAIKTGADSIGFISDYEVRIIGDNTRITDVQIIPGYVFGEMMGHKMIAVECQCASMAIDEYEERNKDYENNDHKPLWVLGEKYFRWFNNNPKKLVRTIIKDTDICYFFINNIFYKCESNNGYYKKTGTSIKKIMMRLSGYNILIDTNIELKNELELYRDMIIKTISDNEFLKNSNETYLRRIKSQEDVISGLYRELNQLNTKVSDFEFKKKQPVVEEHHPIIEEKVAPIIFTPRKKQKYRSNTAFCVDVIRCRSANICSGPSRSGSCGWEK